MLQVAGLVLPLFGLIFLGYVAGRLRKLPIEGLAWLNFFILYIALPALFFRLLARTPVAEFANGSFLLNTSLGTFLIFVLCFLIARLIRKTQYSNRHRAGLCRCVRQYRLHGTAPGHRSIRTAGRRPCCPGVLSRQHHAFHFGAHAHGNR